MQFNSNHINNSTFFFSRTIGSILKVTGANRTPWLAHMTPPLQDTTTSELKIKTIHQCIYVYTRGTLEIRAGDRDPIDYIFIHLLSNIIVYCNRIDPHWFKRQKITSTPVRSLNLRSTTKEDWRKRIVLPVTRKVNEVAI